MIRGINYEQVFAVYFTITFIVSEINFPGFVNSRLKKQDITTHLEFVMSVPAQNYFISAIRILTVPLRMTKHIPPHP
jgi:hypothetical protein